MIFGRVIAAGLTICALAVNASGIQPQSTKTRTHPFAKHLEERYKQHRAAGQAGDLEKYRATVTSEYQAHLKHFTSERLAAISARDFDPREYSLHSVETATNRARVIYVRKEPDRTFYQGLMFHLEGGEWRIGANFQVLDAGDMSGLPKHMKHGLDALLDQPRLKLPSR